MQVAFRGVVVSGKCITCFQFFMYQNVLDIILETVNVILYILQVLFYSSRGKIPSKQLRCLDLHCELCLTFCGYQFPSQFRRLSCAWCFRDQFLSPMWFTEVEDALLQFPTLYNSPGVAVRQCFDGLHRLNNGDSDSIMGLASPALPPMTVIHSQSKQYPFPKRVLKGTFSHAHLYVLTPSTTVCLLF